MCRSPRRNAPSWTTLGAGNDQSCRKRRLFSRNDRTVCVGADNSEHCRRLKEMILHFAHRSSNPICPATQCGLCHAIVAAEIKITLRRRRQGGQVKLAAYVSGDEAQADGSLPLAGPGHEPGPEFALQHGSSTACAHRSGSATSHRRGSPTTSRRRTALMWSTGISVSMRQADDRGLARACYAIGATAWPCRQVSNCYI
jgi:hypothetical protein